MNETNSKIEIRKIGDPAELKIIEDLAWKIFPKTYDGLIPAAQIPYMMGIMYDDKVLRKEFAEGMQFAVISDDRTPIGYICWHFTESEEDKVLRLEKIYLDYAFHGRSIGNMGLRYIIQDAERSGVSYISLNVNKNNIRAQKAYLRAGFYQWRSEREPVGNGFFKNDYIMRYDVRRK